jgi:hypothetical protein
MLNRFGKTTTLVLTALLLSAGASVAQEEDKQVELEIGKWYPKLDFGVVLTQAAYSDNWNGSEQGQVAWNFILNSALTRRFTPRINWANNLKLAFGHTHNQRFATAEESGVRVWDRPEKTTDLIDFESLLRFTLDSWVDPYAALRVLTQFLDNSDQYDRNLWFSPLTVFGSAGVAREFYRTEDEMFLSRVGAAVRSNTRQFYPDAPSVSDNKETETTHDAGVEWVTDYRIKVLEDKVLWTSKLTVYKPFEYSFRGDLEDTFPEFSDYPVATDINWENIFTGQIVSWLTVNLYVMFIYDKYDNSVVPLVDDQGNLTNGDDVQAAVRKAGQFKQTLGISLSWSFL